jgi:hypothetical protein
MKIGIKVLSMGIAGTALCVMAALAGELTTKWAFDGTRAQDAKIKKDSAGADPRLGADYDHTLNFARAFLQNLSTNDVELGYRSDGLVVWRTPPECLPMVTNQPLKVSNIEFGGRVSNYVVITDGVPMVSTPTGDEIRRMAKDGLLCAILGHKWVPDMHVTLEYIPGAITYRRCSICGLRQTQYTGEP